MIRSAMIFLLSTGMSLPLFGETEWEMSRTRSRTVVSLSDSGSRLSVAVDGNGGPVPLAAQWSFSSPLFRAGGLTRSGFVSFFDNRNLASEGKRNGVSDIWSVSRTSPLTGIGAFGFDGAGIYAAHHRDYLLGGLSLRREITDRLSFVNAVEWWKGTVPRTSSGWYHSETGSRESRLLKSVHGVRFKLRSGHDTAVYASATAGNLNPASAAFLFVYEYKSPLREFLLKGAWYGDGYLFKIQKPADRTAVLFASYREKFGKKGFFRVDIGFDLPPVPDLYYILPFETFAAVRGEYRNSGWRLTAENRLQLGSDKEGDGFLKNRCAAGLSWQGLVASSAAVGAAATVRYTCTAEAPSAWKTEVSLLVLYRRQSFSLKASAENGPVYRAAAETVFRLPGCEITVTHQWNRTKHGDTSSLKASVGI